MKRLLNWMLAAILLCGVITTPSSCMKEDNAASSQQAALLKQGVWTEYDTIFVAAGKCTMEELAEMPSVGMVIEGDRATFFTYTAEGAENFVEGAISYDKDANEGTISFPTIKDSPLSGQTVNFTMNGDKLMEFELSYEGVKTTATCSYLCEDLDDWNSDDEGDWEELLTYYQNFPEDAGPDGSIDWSDSDVEGLDQPLTWDDGTVAARGGTRVVGAIVEGVSAGLDIFSSLFEEDPAQQINEKLDQVLGKLDQVLANQEQIKAQISEVNERVKAIAQTMKKDKILDVFNERNKDFYNPLKDQNTQYFDKAYKLYKNNKSDLSKVSKDLSEYAKLWVGDKEEYVTLTWQYIEYLATVQTSYYGKGMAAIYDGLTFDKYPWEHIGINDRKNYRAYDMFMISKCLFMINLYAAYGGLSTKQMEGLYELYNDKKPTLKAFCEFNVSNPNEYRVCQIKGAHFIMHRQLQKYNYCGPNNKAPHPEYNGGHEAVYRPEWHEAGKVKIENPKELISKLIRLKEAQAIYDYYKTAVYSNQKDIHWWNMLVKDKNIPDKDDKAGGAVYIKAPTTTNDDLLFLMLNNHETGNNAVRDRVVNSSLEMTPLVSKNWDSSFLNDYHSMGKIYSFFETGLDKNKRGIWKKYDANIEYYAAIVTKRY